MVSEYDERQFEERLRDLMRDRNLDPEIENRLAKARATAMLEFDSKRRDWRLPAAGVAATAVIAALIWTGRPITQAPAADEIEDLDLLMAEESLEFFEELEFYEWLEYELPADSGNVG